ncbi:beta-sandwich lipoprotein [Rhodococcus sp. NPDC055112]
MNPKAHPKTLIAAIALAGIALTGCATDADVVSENLSKAADQFEINRRIVFFNGITDTYLLTIEGRCAIDDDGNQLEVTCKTQGGEYKKHFLGLSDNVSYVAEQLEGASVSADHYRVIFKPEVIVPDVDRP